LEEEEAKRIKADEKEFKPNARGRRARQSTNPLEEQ
jgi:hypothetical protein